MSPALFTPWGCPELGRGFPECSRGSRLLGRAPWGPRGGQRFCGSAAPAVDSPVWREAPHSTASAAHFLSPCCTLLLAQAPMRDTCIRPRAPWDSWEEGHKPIPNSEHGRAPWDLPGQVSWSAAGPRGWERECGTQGYQRSHVLWGPLGRGLGGLRSQRNIREGGGCWDRSRQRPRV